jgi:hypothetical protein
MTPLLKQLCDMALIRPLPRKNEEKKLSGIDFASKTVSDLDLCDELKGKRSVFDSISKKEDWCCFTLAFLVSIVENKYSKWQLHLRLFVLSRFSSFIARSLFFKGLNQDSSFEGMCGPF